MLAAVCRERVRRAKESPFLQSMDLLESCSVGIVVALVGIAAGAAYFYLGRKSKGWILRISGITNLFRKNKLAIMLLNFDLLFLLPLLCLVFQLVSI